MLAALVAMSLAQHVALFPEAPIADEYARGAALANAGKPLEKLLRDEAKAVAIWYNGWVTVPAEYVTWVSPKLASRWLGYLARRQLWREAEAQARWDAVRAETQGRALFVAELTSFPKLTPLAGLELDFGEGAPAKTGEMLASRFVLTGPDGLLLDVPHKWLLLRQAKSPRGLRDTPWWLLLPELKPLFPEWQRVPEPDMYPTGDYWAAWALVEVPALEQLDAGFELRIVGPRTERVARFGLPARRK